MHAVLMVVTTTLWLAVSTESCISGLDSGCEDGPLPTWEERVEWCIRQGRQVPFLSKRSQYEENKFSNEKFDNRFLPSDLQESPQRVGDELCPLQSKFPSVLQIYCEGSLQYETARGSSLSCVVKLRKENIKNRHCYHQVETRPTWKCESNSKFSCVPCRSTDAINFEIIPRITLDWLHLPKQEISHGRLSAKSQENTEFKKKSWLRVEVTDVDMLMNKSVFCYFIDPKKTDGHDAKIFHFKNSSHIIEINGSYFYPPSKNNTDMNVWCEGVDISTGRIVRSRICQQYNDACLKWVDDRKVNKSLEILANKSRNVANATAMQNALDVVLRSARSLQSRSVSRALQGFETFASTVALGDRRELRLDRSSLFSTLVARSAAGVSASASSLTSLPRGSDAVAVAGDADVTVAAVLPPQAGDRRVSLTRFTGKAVQVFEQRGCTLNSHVVSVTVEGEGVDYVDVVLRRRRADRSGKCAIWNLDSNQWDTTYCEKLVIGEVGDVCRCWHLTHFGEIIVDDDVDWGDSRALDAISMLGCSLSLLGASGVAATAALSDEWRRRPSTKVLLQLVGAVALRDATFVAVAVHDLPDAWCRVAGVALHYAVLAASAWSVAAAVLQALRLGTVAGVATVPHVVLVCALCAWLLPLLPVVLLLGVEGPGAFAKRGDATGLCFPRGFWFYATVAFPAGLAVLVNSCVFFYLTFVIFQCSSDGRRIRKSSNGSTMLRRKLLTCALLFFLFGLTWVFGFPARSFVVACIFCAVATPQGFILFLFFVFGDAQARKKWSSAISSNENSSRTSKKTVSNLTFMKRSSSGTYNVAPLPKGDETTFKSYVATTEENGGERTYHFSGSPPRGGEGEIPQSNDCDLPDSTQIDSGSGMYNFPPTLKNNRSTVVLKSYIMVKEVNDE